MYVYVCIIAKWALKRLSIKNSICKYIRVYVCIYIYILWAARGCAKKRRRICVTHQVCADRDYLQILSNKYQIVVEKHCSGWKQAPVPLVCCLWCSIVTHAGNCLLFKFQVVTPAPVYEACMAAAMHWRMFTGIYALGQ
jgi:hypothetical protein